MGIYFIYCYSFLFFLDFLTLATLLGTGVLGKTVTTSLSTWILSCFKYLIGSLELFLFMAEIVFGTISRIQSISLLDSTALLDLFCRSSCHVISMWAYPFSHHFYYHLASWGILFILSWLIPPLLFALYFRQFSIQIQIFFIYFLHVLLRLPNFYYYFFVQVQCPLSD